MKKVRHLLLATVLVLASLSMAGGAFAQTETYCLDLNAADCTLYQGLQDSSALPASTAFDMQVVGNIEVPEEAPLAFDVAISGAYTTDAEAYQAALDTFGALTLRDVSLGDVATLLDGVVSAWDAELSIDLANTPQLAPFTGGQTIDLYIVDGVAYADLSILTTLMGDPSFDGVFGIDVFEVIDFGLSSVTMADLGNLLEGFGDGFGDMGDLTGENPFADGFQQGFQQGLNQANLVLSEEEVASFATLTRLDDEALNNETVVVFETTIDLAAAVTVPVIREQVLAGIQQQELPDDIDPEALTEATISAFEGSTVIIREKYSEDTGFLVGADFTMDFAIDVDAFTAVVDEAVEEEIGLINFDLDLSFTRNNINNVDAITLPEGAEVVPFAALIGGPQA